MAVFSASCLRPREVNQYIEPLGLYFRIERMDTTTVISFGEKEESVYPNYVETFQNHEMPGFPFYFIVDNTTGFPNIKNILISRPIFYDIHIPDYPYSLEKDRLIMNKEDFSEYIVRLRQSKTVDSMPVADYPEYYAVCLQVSSYDKRIEYWMHDLGDIRDLDSFMDQFIKTPNYMEYSDMKEDSVPLGYRENMSAYGEPKESKRVTVREDNRKSLILGGWLFLDTMDISQRPVLEMYKWQDEDLSLSIIYRIGAYGEKIPVNGVRYVRWMDIQKWKVTYK